MKSLIITAFLLPLVTVFPTPAVAGGGLLQTLPKDGNWTKYYSEGEWGKKQFAGTLTLKSVGRVTERGKACRWIEIETTRNENGKVQHRVSKMLFFEDQLKPDFKKIPEIIRGWTRIAEGSEIKELPEFDKDPDDINGAIWFLFGPNRKDVKKLKATKTIDFQKGELKITEGTSARFEIGPRRNAPAKGGFKHDISLTLWPHTTVPFGTAAIEWEITSRSKGKVIGPKMKMKLTVLDYGTGAKSALPEKK